MGFRSSILAGTRLIRQAINSPDYTPGVSGWTINRDGSAEFNNLDIRGTFLGTDFIMNDEGLFFYSSTPALGNLVGSWAQASGTDAYGNAYVAGVATYSQTGAVFGKFEGGILQLGNFDSGVPDEGNSAEVSIGGAQLDLTSIPNATLGFPNTLVASLLSGKAGVGPGQGEPTLLLQAIDNTAPASMQLSGAVIKTTNSGTVHTWQTVGVGAAAPFNANWSGTTSMGTLTMMPSLRYRFDAEDNVVVQGLFTAAAGAGTAVFQLPLEYRPSINSGPIDVTIRSSAGAITKASMVVSTAGNLNVNANLGSSATAGSVYAISGVFPLGNLP